MKSHQLAIKVQMQLYWYKYYLLKRKCNQVFLELHLSGDLRLNPLWEL